MGAGLTGAAFLYLFRILPDPAALGDRRVIQSTKIFDRNGEVLLYEVYGEEKRTVIPFEQIPDRVKQATLVIEDSSFYKHSAFDWRGIIRAFWINLKSGSFRQGGSTITQQLARSAFLTPEKTVWRKIKELIIAFRLERKYSKDEILNLYLNQIPYGANAYGIEAAAQIYFQKSASKLNLAEAALLAALIKAPTYYSPWGAHGEELTSRKNYILEQMVFAGYIDDGERSVAQKMELQFTPQLQTIQAPHFVIAVQDYLINKYGEDFVRAAGLKVTTTLNVSLQQLAEKVVAEGATRNAEFYQGKNAALVAQDATTGQILALVGSKDYFDIENEGNFNVATQGLRQPGSALKPFAYLTAFKKGFVPEMRLYDAETEFDTSDRPEKSYKPQNFDEKFRGLTTMREGLAQSINIPSVKALYLAGLDETLKTVRDFGVNTLKERGRYGLSLALGGGEVKLLELVGAYGVLSQEGVKHRQWLVLKVEDAQGRILEKYQDQTEAVIDPQYPRLINDILADIKAREPLFQNSLALTVFPNQEVALKTGTTNDYRDAWALGYTPTFVAGVWAGNNDNQPMQKKGGSILAAVPIWSAFMKEALKDRPLQTFAKPEPGFVSNQPAVPEHDILYYFDKDNPQGPPPADPADDPQFANWEEGVMKWLREHGLPTGDLIINITQPANGSFISGETLAVSARIQSPDNLQKLELYWNDALIDLRDNPVADYSYNFSWQPVSFNLQNKLKIKIYSAYGQIQEKEIIVFR